MTDAFKVAKPFNTPTRRFAVGADIEPADVAGSPMGWDDYLARGFVATTRPQLDHDGDNRAGGSKPRAVAETRRAVPSADAPPAA